MDVVELLREEWSTLMLGVSGAAGAALATSQQEWTWAILSAALALSCIRILQLTGWIGDGA
jgi:hypothetical protein